MNKRTALHVTLASLREHDACTDGLARLVAHLGEDWPDDKPINLLSCLESNTVGDVIWALRATLENSDYSSRMIASDCAESVLHFFECEYPDGQRPDGQRPRAAIEAARAFARGEIDAAACAAARDAARDAAWDAAGAARVAAWAAARDAAWAAAWDAAWAAAWAAAGAARAAAGAACAAAWDAACAAERAKQAEILRKWLMGDGDE